jgi:hypothetical protein
LPGFQPDIGQEVGAQGCNRPLRSALMAPFCCGPGETDKPTSQGARCCLEQKLSETAEHILEGLGTHFPRERYIFLVVG